MRVGEIRQLCRLQACPERSRRDEGAVLSLSKYQSLMRAAMTQLNLSARAYHRTRSVKLARSEEIKSVQLAEALHLRPSEVDA